MNTIPLIIGGLGATELLIIGAIIMLMFGASKLPELARGSGQALRIFKSETKGLIDDDKTDATPDAGPGTRASHKAEKVQVDTTPIPTSEAIIEPEPVIVTTAPRSSTD